MRKNCFGINGATGGGAGERGGREELILVDFFLFLDAGVFHATVSEYSSRFPWVRESNGSVLFLAFDSRTINDRDEKTETCTIEQFKSFFLLFQTGKKEKNHQTQAKNSRKFSSFFQRIFRANFFQILFVKILKIFFC